MANKKSQAYLLGGFMLFAILALFIISKSNSNLSIEAENILTDNIANEFVESLNAFFLKNNSAKYINSGLLNYSCIANNFSKSKGWDLNSYYIVVMPNVSVIFGNNLGQNINNISVSINDETLSKSVSVKNNSIFYFNNSNNNLIYLNYSFSTNKRDFEKTKTIQNAMHYIYWIKLTKGENIVIKEISG